MTPTPAPILYTKPACGQCDMTKLVLDRDGVTYDSIDITQDSVALEHVLSLGYRAAPVMYVNATNHWSGFRPDKLKSLKLKAA